MTEAADSPERLWIAHVRIERATMWTFIITARDESEAREILEGSSHGSNGAARGPLANVPIDPKYRPIIVPLADGFDLRQVPVVCRVWTRDGRDFMESAEHLP
jgi:hypothetical protein